MLSAISVFAALFILCLTFENVISCYPCQCRIGNYYISGPVKTGDCWTGRVSARVNKIPNNFDTDIAALEMTGQSLTLNENDLQLYKDLQVINLHNCNLKEVPQSIFKNSSQVIVIWLNDNKLTAVQSYLFNNLLHLKEISLARNNISIIDENCFYNLPSLELLDISSNSIRTLNIKLHEFNNLKSVKMNYNPWICDINLCDVINEVSSKQLWGSDVPICNNLFGKRWDELKVPDISPVLASSTKIVEKGKDLTLQCKYCFFGHSNVIWVVNHFGREFQIFSPSKNDQLSATSTLTVNNISHDDAGIYSCRIENCDNCQAASTSVSVIENNIKPKTHSTTPWEDIDATHRIDIDTTQHTEIDTTERIDIDIIDIVANQDFFNTNKLFPEETEEYIGIMVPQTKSID